MQVTLVFFIPRIISIMTISLSLFNQLCQFLWWVRQGLLNIPQLGEAKGFHIHHPIGLPQVGVLYLWCYWALQEILNSKIGWFIGVVVARVVVPISRGSGGNGRDHPYSRKVITRVVMVEIMVVIMQGEVVHKH